MSLLELQNVSKSFDGVHALDGVSIDFPGHGIVALIGPNGAGKSTLINVITGFVQPEKGHCFVKGVETTNWAPQRVAALGVRRTFQAVKIFPEMSASDNILMAFPADSTEQVLSSFRPRLYRRVDEQKRVPAMGALEKIGLSDKADELAKKLSYGQQKLLSLAMCVASGVSIILLDEPFSGLDPKISEVATNFLKELTGVNRLIIFIEHDLIAVGKVADFVYLLAEGKVVESGPPQTVLTNQAALERFFGRG
jgi:ABC-type branched-subunit amino acid transport system ATPase component